jgi:hypothetical protein
LRSDIRNGNESVKINNPPHNVRFNWFDGSQ